MNPLEKYEYVSEAFKPFSAAHELSFTARLARENHWSYDYCEAIIEEYLKFCVLSLYVDHPVTPSDEVDQVWHLHLQYTEHYIEVFCKELLGTTFYHGPTKGGGGERVKFHEQYSKTQRSYEEHFGEINPAYWPDAEVRFGRSIYYQRVNILENLVISKKRATWLLAYISALVAVLLVKSFY